MNWFYAINNQQSGPVDDNQLEALLRAGTIQPDTLVWHEGMADWQPVSVARGNPPLGGAASPMPTTGAPGTVMCVECRRFYPLEEVIRYGDQTVCAVCKPIFLQRLREGVATPKAFIYASFGSRFGAKILDGIILWVIGYVLGILVPALSQSGTDIRTIIPGMFAGIVTGLLYTSLLHWKFGATVGKMAVKIKVIRPDGAPLTYGRAIGRSFAEYLSSLTLGIGYLMAAFDAEGRSLHDRIADTRVISAR